MYDEEVQAVIDAFSSARQRTLRHSWTRFTYAAALAHNFVQIGIREAEAAAQLKEYAALAAERIAVITELYRLTVPVPVDRHNSAKVEAERPNREKNIEGGDGARAAYGSSIRRPRSSLTPPARAADSQLIHNLHHSTSAAPIASLARSSCRVPPLSPPNLSLHPPALHPLTLRILAHPVPPCRPQRILRETSQGAVSLSSSPTQPCPAAHPPLLVSEPAARQHVACKVYGPAPRPMRLLVRANKLALFLLPFLNEDLQRGRCPQTNRAVPRYLLHNGYAASFGISPARFFLPCTSTGLSYPRRSQRLLPAAALSCLSLLPAYLSSAAICHLP
ncbi:hypothetical protein DFH09DRAFT_1086345 [Mycena vulgaris]|nr:hypothetical protein DFH09DRAFT_1086345 [Mycena vulgaris]